MVSVCVWVEGRGHRCKPMMIPDFFQDVQDDMFLKFS
jgi:hypothetical protein